MSKQINQSDVFVLLWCVYYLQGIVYPSGIINQVTQLLMILIGLVALFHYITHNAGSRLINATIALIVMYSIYGGWLILFGNGLAGTVDTTYLKDSLNSLLPIIFFYNQTKRGNLTQFRISIYTIIILFIAIAQYYSYAQMLYDKGLEEGTNNIGYSFVTMIPLVFFFARKPILQYLLLGIIIMYVVMGMKRGAIAIGCFSVLIFLYSGLKVPSTKKRLFIVALSILIVIVSIDIIQYMLTTSNYFASRIEDTIDGNTSGRDYIYSRIWSIITEENNLLKILFGHGANSTVRFVGNYAHQDWLETACNNGFIGVIILLNFFIVFGGLVLKSRKYFSIHLYYCFITLFFICFAKTMFSMSIQNLDMSQSMLIGYFGFQMETKRSQVSQNIL